MLTVINKVFAINCYLNAIMTSFTTLGLLKIKTER